MPLQVVWLVPEPWACWEPLTAGYTQPPSVHGSSSLCAHPQHVWEKVHQLGVPSSFFSFLFLKFCLASSWRRNPSLCFGWTCLQAFLYHQSCCRKCCHKTAVVGGKILQTACAVTHSSLQRFVNMNGTDHWASSYTPRENKDRGFPLWFNNSPVQVETTELCCFGFFFPSIHFQCSLRYRTSFCFLDLFSSVYWGLCMWQLVF